jgi:hypothetical protein
MDLGVETKYRVESFSFSSVLSGPIFYPIVCSFLKSSLKIKIKLIRICLVQTLKADLTCSLSFLPFKGIHFQSCCFEVGQNASSLAACLTSPTKAQSRSGLSHLCLGHL